MRAICIDPGSKKIGIAVIVDGVILGDGVVKANKATGVIRIKSLMRVIGQLVVEHKVTTIYVEATNLVGQLGHDAKELQAGFQHDLKAVCLAHQLDLYLINPQTLKLEFSGSGRAKKDDMISTCVRVFKKTPADDNHADALAIAWCAINKPDVFKKWKPSVG